MMNDRLEYLIQLQEANLQISANNNVLLQRILAGMDEGNAFSRGVAENVTAYYAIQAIEKARNNMPD
ncbi:hypothetical protein [Parabacteroides goldsteinii]|uniref:hypothetical protein n=1 Tax=Parabacteroides goldsteinii TaxID=328812 RepID=UPI00242CD7AF|nr:hypothetical protein [Parabacteroides goldsteinii]